MIQSETQHKLSVHVISTVEDSESVENDIVKPDKNLDTSDATDTIEHKEIDDILTFKLSQSLYPLLKPFNDIPRKGAHSSKL